jgi:hypothetical protein
MKRVIRRIRVGGRTLRTCDYQAAVLGSFAIPGRVLLVCIRDAVGSLISAAIAIVCKAASPLPWSNNFHVDLISLHDSCFYASQHSSTPFLPSFTKASCTQSPNSGYSWPFTDASCKPVMYHRNSHQTDICLEMLLTAQVPFR